MIIIGIDPGLSGAMAIVGAHDNWGSSTLIEVVDMPTVEVVRNNKKKRELSAALVAKIIKQKAMCYTTRSAMPENVLTYMERVNAMPGQGVSSVFSFGRSVGIMEGVLAALGLGVTIVTPQAWQKGMEVRDGKDGSRARAMELSPVHSLSFERKKDDGRADAFLIAMYGLKLAHQDLIKIYGKDPT